MNHHSYKIKLAYKGTNFSGWQIQADPKLRTIQGELNKTLKGICKSDDVKTLGAGRTDAGVHAFNQVARVVIPLDISTDGIINGINSLIDPEIRILKCKKVDGKFNPISESLTKEYLYIFTDQRRLSPFALSYMGNVGYSVNFELMQKAAEIFIGKKDFINFRCTGTETPDTIREILEVELTKISQQGFWKLMSDDYYMLRIKGTGFLKQMVRLIMGCIWMAGREKTSLQEIEDAFSHKLPKRLGPVAPASGLYLNKIEYADGL